MHQIGPALKSWWSLEVSGCNSAEDKPRFEKGITKGTGRWLGRNNYCLLTRSIWSLLFVIQSCPTLCDPMDCSPPGEFCPWNSPCKKGTVGCHSLLQGIFPTQESNPGLHSAGRVFTIWATKEAQHLEQEPQIGRPEVGGTVTPAVVLMSHWENPVHIRYTEACYINQRPDLHLKVWSLPENSLRKHALETVLCFEC